MVLLLCLWALHDPQFESLPQLDFFPDSQPLAGKFKEQGLSLLIYFDDEVCTNCLNRELAILKTYFEDPQNPFQFIMIIKGITDYRLKKFVRARLVGYPIFKETEQVSLGVKESFALFLVDLSTQKIISSYFPRIEDDLEVKTRTLLKP